MNLQCDCCGTFGWSGRELADGRIKAPDVPDLEFKCCWLCMKALQSNEMEIKKLRVRLSEKVSMPLKCHSVRIADLRRE